MSGQLSGKVVAITGAASGIGLACVRGCLDAGAKVVLVDYAEDKLRDLAAELGPDAIPLRIDLTDPASVATMLPGILQKAGRLDAFHANAGAYIGGDVVDGDPDAWDRMLTLNVNAVFRTIHAVLPHMIERGEGDIVVTSSVAGHTAVPWEPIYTASKHAVQAFVHALRRQVAKHNIRVGAIAPGPVLTPLVANWPKENLDRAIAAGNLFDPKEIAEVLVFMLTRSRTVTIRDIVILPRNFDI
ncbi:SDR family oxidoreductase [Kumtagia ephedrae]|uniref:Glucose dehydrogenase n=1 Tax=Kumtagia ephedrae TaxID=2116701 RepID=A0A2P7S2U1_9HYPH|nr:SDR family oxidoreductase [Mesorhizobium ephedrae]PSJ56782.1 glucose dehydrogenase [Mesorhizobium ephedrae]